MLHYDTGTNLSVKTNFRARDTTSFYIGPTTTKKMKVSNDGGIGIMCENLATGKQIDLPPVVLSLEVWFTVYGIIKA
jgi:hypothetical protein